MLLRESVIIICTIWPVILSLTDYWPMVRTALLTAGVVAGFTACQTTDNEAERYWRTAPRQMSQVETSGFLEDYSQLKPNATDSSQLLYVNPATKFHSYYKVMIDPITIWPGPNSNLSKLPQEELTALGDYLHQSVIEELQKDYVIVPRPAN